MNTNPEWKRWTNDGAGSACFAIRGMLGTLGCQAAVTRYLPTLRGWIAFILAAFAILYFPVVRPALIVASGRGTFAAERVTPTVWVTGAVLIVVCLVASVEAFRRGSRADKWFAGIAGLLTIGLAVQYFELAFLPVHKSPNQSLQPEGREIDW